MSERKGAGREKAFTLACSVPRHLSDRTEIERVIATISDTSTAQRDKPNSTSTFYSPPLLHPPQIHQPLHALLLLHTHQMLVE